MCGLTCSYRLINYSKTHQLYISKRLFSKFDIFKKLSDTGEAGGSTSARKPSDRVIKLVDEILNLTLIEAADLCDLCQEKLSERSDKPTGLAPGRSPFPHPQSMFAYGSLGPMSFMPTQPPITPPNPIQDNVENIKDNNIKEDNIKENQTPTTNINKGDDKVSIKLMSFDAAKKIALVKQVRSITGLGLRESKDLVEGAPKVLKKGITTSEAEEIKDALEKAGAVTEIY